MAELMLGQPLFPGESGIDQLVEIIKVLGTPTRDQIRTMNPNYMEHKFPQIKPHPFNKVNSPTYKQDQSVLTRQGLPQGKPRRHRSHLGIARVYPDSTSFGDRGNVPTILR